MSRFSDFVAAAKANGRFPPITRSAPELAQPAPTSRVTAADILRAGKLRRAEVAAELPAPGTLARQIIDAAERARRGEA